MLLTEIASRQRPAEREFYLLSCLLTGSLPCTAYCLLLPLSFTVHTHLHTQQRVAEECGLLDVLPAHWVAPVYSVLPGSGYPITWDALWAELSPGVSLQNLVGAGAPPPAPGELLNLLQRRVNSSDVVLAAIFDLLTSQCDRHGQNVYVSESGRLALIDNDQAYGSSELGGRGLICSDLI